MSSHVLRSVRPSNLLHWISVNAAGSLKKSVGESWRAYLAANSGPGKTYSEQEGAFLSGQTGADIKEKLRASVNATPGGTSREKIRNKYV